MFLVSGAAVHLAGFSHGLPFVSVGARSVGQRTCGRGDWLASVLELPACARLDLFFFIERVTTVDMDQHVPVWFGSGVCGGACRGQSRVHRPSGSGSPVGNSTILQSLVGMSGTVVCYCWSRTIVEPCETTANPTGTGRSSTVHVRYKRNKLGLSGNSNTETNRAPRPHVACPPPTGPAIDERHAWWNRTMD